MGMRMKRLLTTAMLLLTAALSQPQEAMARRAAWAKLSPMLRQLAMTESVGYQTAHTPATATGGQQRGRSVSVLLRCTSGHDAASVIGEHGGRELARVGDISIATLPVSRLCEASLDPRVAAIQSGPRAETSMDVVAGNIHAAEAHGALSLPQAFRGEGVMVGVMDVGFDLTHPNFFDATHTHYRIERFWDQLSADTVGSTLYVGRDYAGREELLALAHSRDGLDQTHGTHTLGSAAGSGYNSRYRGIAPESRICLVANAVVDDMPFISEDDVYKYTYATDALGFKYIFDYADSQGVPCVASFSEGSREDFWGYDKLYYDLLDSLAGPGHIIVASAGNKGTTPAWMHKPKGQPSAGAFIVAYKKSATLTLKTDNTDSLTVRIVTYGTPNDTLLLPVKRILDQPDSVFSHTIYNFSPPRSVTMQVVAYPSCYNPRETCFDFMMTDTLGSIGSTPRMSFELLGISPDAEVYAGDFSLRSRSENPALNDGQPCRTIHSPSSAPRVISVGATAYRTSYVNYQGMTRSSFQDGDGKRCTYSSTGPAMYGRVKPDVLAPGENVISSYSSYYLENHPQASDINSDVEHFDVEGRTYAWNANSGTSMSAPCVAGTIALWLQAKPDLTPEEVLQVLDKTCHRYDPSLSYPNNEYGYGEIDAYAGLLCLLGLDTTENVSRRHTAATIGLTPGGLITIGMPDGVRHHVTVCVADLAGRQLAKQTVAPGITNSSILLPAAARGLLVVQLTGDQTVEGSTIVRR